MPFDYDVIIIGAGTAGLRAAKVCLKNGASYALVEKGRGGTLCAEKGCMPSKTLIEAANIFHTRKKFKKFDFKGAETLHNYISTILGMSATCVTISLTG